MTVSPGGAPGDSVSGKVDRAMRLLRRRLARSKALRLAAVHPHDCEWDGLPGQCAGQHRPAA
ncbi:MAG TPA: hypothetical protein VE990_14800 [Acidimicrobiales bacterium]|nr:hypothetical protein [Acidimicrobiales bacterium]